MQKIMTVFILLSVLIACENRIKDETINYPEFNSKQFNQDIMQLEDSEDQLENVGIRFEVSANGTMIDDNFKTASGVQDDDDVINSLQDYKDEVDHFLNTYDRLFKFNDKDGKKSGYRYLDADYSASIKEKYEIANSIIEKLLID